MKKNRFRNSKVSRAIHRIPRRRLAAGGAALLILFSALVGLPINTWLTAQKYKLNNDTLKVIGHAKPSLANKLVFNDKLNIYEFNADAKKPAETSNSNDPNVVGQMLQKQQQQKKVVGDTKDANLYSLDLPTDPNQGIRIYDNNSDLSIKLVPRFEQSAGRKVQDRLVYPMPDGAKAVYTVKNNGLKEDVVFGSAPKSGSASFSYNLEIPDNLEARILDDNSLGVYSADPALFGDISYGADEDRVKVESARQNAKKDYLVFAIPRPTIVSANGSIGEATAFFTLEAGVLTVKATNLNTVKGAFSIDPSVVVTSSSDFASGTNEDSIEYGVNEIKRTGLGGGSIGTFANTTMFVNTRRGHTSVVNNGFVYVLGGDDGTVFYNDVQYAPLNADGTIGTWATTTSFTTARKDHTTVVFSGYVYVIGGFATNSGVFNDVQYAPLNADGTIGTWATTTSFTTARADHTSVVYNGYLYILGGSNIVGTIYGDVQYAPFNATGTLGAWAATTIIPTNRFGHTSVVNNGYVYVIGGSDGTNTLNSVQYARFNANGTIGTWSNGTLFNTARYQHTSIVSNGYLYIISGENDATQAAYNDVQYAPFNADGSVGDWTSTNITGARYSHTSVVYNGYVYVLDGAGSLNGVFEPSIVGTTQFAKINPAGNLATFATSATSPATARAWSSAVAMNGYLYMIGGCSVVSADTCSTASTLVSYAKINPDGTLGTWANATNALTAARGMGAAIGYNGYLFYIGGRPTSTTVSANMLSVPVSAATGNTTAAWTTVAAPTGYTASWGHSAVVYDNNLYVLGGCTSTAVGCTTYTNTVSYAKLTATGGFATNPSCANNLCPLNAFTTARWGHGVTINGNKLYVQGGLHAASDTLCNGTASTLCSDVQYTTIGTTGTLGTWASTTNETTARYGHAFAASKGYLYVSSGKTGTAAFLQDAMFAKLTTTGTISTDSGCGTAWCSTVNATVARGGAAALSSNGTVYLVSGQNANATVTAAVYTAAINNGGTGSANAWATISSTGLTSRSGHTTVVNNGYVYVLGNSSVTGQKNDVQFAPINADRTLGTWQYTYNSAAAASYVGGYSTVRSKFSSVVYNNKVYVIGGTTAAGQGASGTRSDVQYAPLNSDGTVGTWVATTSISSTILGADTFSGRDGLTSFARNNRLYIIGGHAYDAPLLQDAYFDTNKYAPINTDGSLGAWVDLSSVMSAGRSEHTMVVYNDRIYVIGGYKLGTLDNGVDSAPINGDGTIGTWTLTTSVPGIRRGAAAAALNGYLYVFSGRTGSIDYNDVQYAPFNADGTIGTWSATSSFSNSRSGASSFVQNGYIYLIAGAGITGPTTYGDIQYTSLNSIPRVARYSKRIDMGTTTTISDITYAGTIPGGKSSISYRLAGTDGVFGSSQSASGLTGTCTAGGTSRYLLLSVLMDDTGTGTFPDSTPASLQDISIFYSAGGAGGGVLPTERLRGGKTLQQAAGLGGLDISKSYPGGAVSCT